METRHAGQADELHTIDSYIRGVRYYLEWCASRDPLDRRTLQIWVTYLLDGGAPARL